MMAGPFSPKKQEQAAPEEKAQFGKGTELKVEGTSDVSAGAYTTIPYHRRESRSTTSQIGSISTSPRYSEVTRTSYSELTRTSKGGGKQSSSALPSVRGLKLVISDTKGFALTPRTGSYICAQRGPISGPASARSLGTATTVSWSEESPRPAGVKEAVRGAEKTQVYVLPTSKEATTEHEVPPLYEEAKRTIQPTPRVRRQPWIGPAYTAVHTPPYTAQTPEYGRTENLLDPSRRKPKDLSDEERFTLQQDIEIRGRRYYVSLSGRPHFTAYPHRPPPEGSYLEDYPVPPPRGRHSFDKDPLLRSVLTPQDNFPYIREQATYHGQPLNYTHNDWMLNNVMDTTQAEKYCPGTVPVYADIQHFGRVQGVYMRQPDGSVYPLVTLPKMTPADILKVLDRMNRTEGRKRRKQSTWSRLLCCGVADAGEM